MLTFTIIQTALVWEDVNANLSLLQRKIDSIDEPTQVIVLPEMFTTGFSMQPHLLAETMDGSTIQWMKENAIRKRVIICGSIMLAENNTFFNRFIWMLPNGTFSYYDKRHLFTMGNEPKHYANGNKKLITQVNGVKINCQICYDLRFPVWARQQDELYDVLLYVANWPEKRSKAWKTLLVARAIENQCYVIGVNRVGEDGNGVYHSGNSMIIDPLGEVLFHKSDEEVIHTFSVDKQHIDSVREKLPFLKDGDKFNILL